MKSFATISLVFSLSGVVSFGQGAQADLIKRKAKELNNQNNVRQGVPTPAQTQPQKVVRPTAATNAVVSLQGVAKLKHDLAAFKADTAPTEAQKQQLAVDLAQCARGAKPSPVALKKIADSLAAVLSETSLTAAQQDRLAQNLDGVMNAKLFPARQFDQIIADVQAILEVGSIKRTTAIAISEDLKTVGAELRH